MSDAVVGLNAAARTTIRLRSGRYLCLADPRPDQFTLGDIASGVSKMCRFNGQVDQFYSVAEHLLRCVRVAEADGHPIAVQRAVLMHDAAEAFVCDLTRPLKAMLSPAYHEIERRVEAVIWDKYDLPVEFGGVIKEIDNAMLIAEKRAMFSNDGVAWQGEHEVRELDVYFGHWPPREAEEVFLRACRELGIKD